MNISMNRKNDTSITLVFYKSGIIEGYVIDIFLHRNGTYDNDHINGTLLEYNHISMASEIVIFVGILSLGDIVMHNNYYEFCLYKLTSDEVLNIRNKMIEDNIIEGRVIIPRLLMTNIIDFLSNN